jgi:hypothetical protein
MTGDQIGLLVVRLIGGIAAVLVGVLGYPFGTKTQPDQAVPVALIIVGAIVALQAVLDLLWIRLSNADSGRAVVEAQDSSASVIGVFVAAVATVLGLVAVFSSQPAFAIRLGTLVLVIGLILGLMMLGYVAYGIGGPGTARLIAWLATILFAATSFGLACLGLSVYYK